MYFTIDYGNVFGFTCTCIFPKILFSHKLYETHLVLTYRLTGGNKEANLHFSILMCNTPVGVHRLKDVFGILTHFIIHLKTEKIN